MEEKSPRRNEKSQNKRRTGIICTARAGRSSQNASACFRGAGALTAPLQQLNLSEYNISTDDVNVKILIDQIILVAQNNNDKVLLLSQIVDRIKAEF